MKIDRQKPSKVVELSSILNLHFSNITFLPSDEDPSSDKGMVKEVGPSQPFGRIFVKKSFEEALTREGHVRRPFYFFVANHVDKMKNMGSHERRRPYNHFISYTTQGPKKDKN